MTRPRVLTGDAAHAYLEAALILATLPDEPDAQRHWDELGRAIGRTCRIPHCATPAKAGGMCDMHYRRHRRATHNQQAHIVNLEHTMHAPRRRPATETIEDVEWMLDTNETPARIAQRLGTNASALDALLRRAGRHDLAARFQATASAERAAS